MLDVVKDFNTKEFIDYLERKDLKLDKNDIKIFCKEKIAGFDFFNITKEEFQSYYSMKAGPIKRLAKFIKSLSQKLQNYFLLKTLNNLK